MNIVVRTYYVYHGGFQKYNRKVDIYEYHHISLMFVSIQLLCIGKFYAFCIARANLTLQGCRKRGSGGVFGRRGSQGEQIMPTKLLLPPTPIFLDGAASLSFLDIHININIQMHSISNWFLTRN